jgi:HK97 family phage major capsid protein
MFPDTMLQEIKKIVETTTGRPIWLPNMAGGAPDTILGYPLLHQSEHGAAPRPDRASRSCSGS